MTTPNGWHHHERVYIQGRHEDLVLVQYTERQKIRNKVWTRDGDVVSARITGYVIPWAWLPANEVKTDEQISDLDAALLRIWTMR
jgi:hypothetical protein